MKRTGGFTVIEILVVVMVLGIIILAGGWWWRQSDNQQTDGHHQISSAPSTSPTKFGVSLSPKSYTAEDFPQFFQQAASLGSIVTWAGDSSQLNDDQSAATVVTALAGQYHYTPLIITDHHDLAAITAYAEQYQPSLIGVGNEVNLLKNAEMQNLIAAYPSIVSAIKSVSPDTQVMIIFQLEQLMGLRGGLFGGENDTGQADWELLDLFPEADVIGFTSYPSMVYQHPSAIPNDYFDRIGQFTDKPIALTEIGWPTSEAIAGWESSEEEQSIFVGRLAELLTDDIRYVIWAFVYDQTVQAPFNSMGLIASDGTMKAAYQRWLEIRP